MTLQEIDQEIARLELEKLKKLGCVCIGRFGDPIRAEIAILPFEYGKPKGFEEKRGYFYHDYKKIVTCDSGLKIIKSEIERIKTALDEAYAAYERGL